MSGQLPPCDMGAIVDGVAAGPCSRPVAMVDKRGFVYCDHHGLALRSYWSPCRKLRPHELRRLERGEVIARY